MGTSRFVYNKLIDYLKQPETIANLSLKTVMLKDLPEWASDVPFAIKGDSALEAIRTVQKAKKNYITTGEITECKFRSRKNPIQSIPVQKQNVRKGGFYPTLLGQLRTAETIRGTSDGRLIFENGRWFYTESYECSYIVPENQRYDMVAIDPGVRTFATLYSNVLVGKVGKQDIGRIYRLCTHLDKLMSEMSQSKSDRKYRLKKAARRLRWKIKDLVGELHYKLAVWLCKTFKVVLLPTFEVSGMIGKSDRKISSRTARQMLTLSHYSFKQILKNTSVKYGTIVVDVNEAFTSKTCSNCGTIHDIKSAKRLKCKCGIAIDRDVNGARGIFLRALRDISCSVEIFDRVA